MINIVFCVSEGSNAGLEDAFDFKSVTHLIEYREAVLLLDKFLSDVIRYSRKPVLIKLLLRYKGEINLIDIRNVCYIEVTKRVLEVHVTEKAERVYRAYASITDLAKILRRLGFVRVSRFFVVSVDHIRKICGTQIELSVGREISVGRIYREKLLEILYRKPNIVLP